MVELYRERLDKLSGSYAFKLPFQMYTDHVQRVDELGENISAAIDSVMEVVGQKTDVLEGKLRILNPLNILKKGYSVVYDNDGNIIRDSKMATENINIALYKGRLEARVTKKRD